MMNKLMKFFPALAMVMAVTLAFGFAPAKKVPTRKQQYNGSSWSDIPLTFQRGVHYSCTGQSQDCTRELDEDNNVISGSVEVGTYAPI